VLAEREAQPRQGVTAQRGQHVGLVLGGVHREPQQAVGGAARVVAGRQRRRAEPVGEAEHRVEADVAVAAHAGVRRQPVGVPAQPGSDDPVAELVAQVEREMRQAELVREPPGTAHRSGRAAGGLPVVVGVGPQLERHGYRTRVRLAEQRGDRAVDAAGHRDERALRVSRQRSPGACRGAERAVQRVGDEIGGVQLASAQAAELGGDPRRADPGGVQQAGALDELHGGAAGGEHRAAARGVEAGRRHPRAVDRQREAHEVAAGGATRRAVKRAVDRPPAAARAGQVVFEALVGHPSSLVS
jgi:hypothetical protein